MKNGRILKVFQKAKEFNLRIIFEKLALSLSLQASHNPIYAAISGARKIIPK